MSKEKEKGIEELYNYLVKNKDKMSKEEYNELKKDFGKSLFKLYSEKAISKEFFENYSKKLKELDKKKIEKERPSSKKPWPLVIGLIVIICVAIGGSYLLWSGGGTETSTTTSVPTTTIPPTSTPEPPRFIIEDLIVPLEIEEGEKTILSVIVKNEGGNGEDDITIWIGDEKVVRNVYIPENSTETIEVTFDVELPDIFRYAGLEIIVKSGSISKTIKVSPKTTITTVPLTTTPKPTTPKPKTWHTVETFSGTGDRTTHWFSIKGDEWRVKYKFSSSSSSCPFYVFIYPKGETKMYTAAWDCTGHCDDTTYIYSGKGEYYFNIITTSWGKWELTVEDYY